VLVSVLVLAVGLLGLAGLQTQSLRFNHEASLRTVATILAMDMADRLRANRHTALTTDNYKFGLDEAATGSSAACETAACAGGALAQYDFAQWREAIEEQLPGGRGAVDPGVLDAAGWREYTITLEYYGASVDKSGADGTADPVKYTFNYRTRI